MGSLLKTAAAALLGLSALGVTAAYADHDEGYRSDGSRGESYRPERCDKRHDHRAHNADYYSYYPADDFYRAGAYKGVSVTIGVGGGRADADYGYGDRYRDRGGYDGRDGGYGGRDGRYGDRYGDRYGYGQRSRVVHRDVLPTRYDARVVIVEEAFYTRQGGDRYGDRDGRYGDRYGDRDGRYGDRYGDRDGRYGDRYGDRDGRYGDRSGERRVCTVQAQGPEHHYVTYGQLRQLASIHCSHYAQVRILN